LYNVIDMKTRYLLDSHLADKRYLWDARIVLARAGRKVGKKPRAVITDSIASYPQAIENVFVANVRHIKYKGLNNSQTIISSNAFTAYSKPEQR
jgi:transposase-like protein